jgi:hypothetical protein
LVPILIRLLPLQILLFSSDSVLFCVSDSPSPASGSDFSAADSGSSGDRVGESETNQ